MEEDTKPDKALLDQLVQGKVAEEKKPDKVLLDKSIHDMTNAMQIDESDWTSLQGPSEAVSVKIEPEDNTGHEGNLESAIVKIKKLEQAFPSYLETKYLPNTTIPIQDVPGPSSSNGDLSASQILSAMAQQSHQGPGTMETGLRKPSVFHIDTSLIQGASSAEQTNELEGLGVSVYNQEEFEAGVMQQVDQAITLEEEKAVKERAEKDLNNVLTDIRTCKQELSRMDRLINAVQLPKVQTLAMKEAHRKMLSIKTQRENKAKQLKKLRARHKSLLAKLSGSSVGLEPSDDEADAEPSEGDANILKGLLQAGATMSNQETEQERMIRLGEMTPFGTTMSFANTTRKVNQQKKAVSQSTQEMTDFEKAMLEKDDLAMKKHKEAAMANKMAKKRRLERERQALVKKKEDMSKKKKTSDKPSRKDKSKQPKISSEQEASPKETSENTFKDGTYFVYKPTRSESSDFPKQRKKKKGMGYKDLRPNWGSDDEMSDFDNGDVLDDNDDYLPDEEEIREAEDDDDFVPDEVISPKGKGKGKKRKISEDIEDGVITSLDDLKAVYGVKRKKPRNFNFTKKCKDDSSQDQYFRRLRENKKKRLREKQRKIERGEDDSDSEDEEDMEFEGGLKIPAAIWNKLYRYQKTGVKWLWELHQQQAGGVVGDEMGLGKTIQMIAFLSGLKCSKLRSRGTRYIGLGPVLIVCPTTVMHQWVKEFHTWSPEFRVAILHDSGSHSGSRAALVKDIAISHSVLVTSYSSVRLRQDILLRHDWHYVILDEGHKIRNPDAHVTLACKQFRTPHRIILSGSPMQNNLRELWSLFDFVFPGKLGTLPVFMEKFSVPITIGGYANATSVQVQTAYKCACVLRDTINPYLLRRMKSDVKSTLQLPQKNEQVLFCRLSDAQTALYKEYLESKECQLILNKEYQVFAGLITLRKICNHPDLVSGGPHLLISETPDDANLPEDLHYGYWKRSGKMVVVESLLKLWKQQGHRVLLFSQSKQMLDIMEDFVKDRYTYMRMDGGTPIASRQSLINKFNAIETIFVFLLTTRVGGLGVNLTGANRVVIFDPDWNPSTDTQARERAWRIGQTKQVTIYRLLTTGTIEEKIYHRQIFKTFLSNRVLKDPRQRRFFKSNDLFELFSLGSSATTHGTETSAIFAGTGSDVRVKMSKVPKTPNLTKSATLPRTKSTGNMRTRTDAAEVDPEIKVSKVKRSSSIPLKLSEHGNDSNMPNGKSAMKTVEPVFDKNGAKIGDESPIKTRHDKEKTKDTPSTPTSKGSSNAVTSPEVKASLAERARQLARQLVSKAKDSGTPHHSPVKSPGKLKSSSPGAVRSEGTSQSRTATKVTSPADKKRKKKKKKKQDASIEGHRIANLAKHSEYRPAGQDEEEEKKRNEQLDDYVLHKLFKKSGVHSALQHDNIMNSANPDYMLVENEADRVAKEAVKALKQSRQRCMTAASGVPTWTGASGQSGAPPGIKKPRFGQKVNSKVAGLKKPTPATTGKPSPLQGRFGGAKKKKLFQGDSEDSLARSNTSSPALPASTDLLAKMRARNHIVLDANESEEDENNPGIAPGSGQETDELLKDIHQFVAFQGEVDGQATTAELLKEFKSRLPKNSTAVFKAMLTKICAFHRKSGGEGVWKLKQDFR